jgi:hypothetical protein
MDITVTLIPSDYVTEPYGATGGDVVRELLTFGGLNPGDPLIKGELTFKFDWFKAGVKPGRNGRMEGTYPSKEKTIALDAFTDFVKKSMGNLTFAEKSVTAYLYVKSPLSAEPKVTLTANFLDIFDLEGTPKKPPIDLLTNDKVSIVADFNGSGFLEQPKEEFSLPVYDGVLANKLNTGGNPSKDIDFTEVLNVPLSDEDCGDLQIDYDVNMYEEGKEYVEIERSELDNLEDGKLKIEAYLIIVVPMAFKVDVDFLTLTWTANELGLANSDLFNRSGKDDGGYFDYLDTFNISSLDLTMKTKNMDLFDTGDGKVFLRNKKTGGDDFSLEVFDLINKEQKITLDSERIEEIKNEVFPFVPDLELVIPRPKGDGILLFKRGFKVSLESVGFSPELEYPLF